MDRVGMNDGMIPISLRAGTTSNGTGCVRGGVSASARGFTLIELLVVITILAMLVSLMVPSLGRVQRRARQVGCVSNLRRMGVAMFQYIQDHDGRQPNVQGKLTDSWHWHHHIYPYIGLADHGDNVTWEFTPRVPFTRTILTCPEMIGELGKPEGSNAVSYGINIYVGYNRGKYSRYGYVFRNPSRDDDPMRPVPGPLSDTAWVTDQYEGGRKYFTRRSGGPTTRITWAHGEDRPWNLGGRDTAGVLFMDGHVEMFRDPGFDTPDVLTEYEDFFGRP